MLTQDQIVHHSVRLPVAQPLGILDWPALIGDGQSFCQTTADSAASLRGCHQHVCTGDAFDGRQRRGNHHFDRIV